MALEVKCPVDFVSINQNKARITAALICMVSVLYLFIPHWLLAAFLALDFITRCFFNSNYSVLFIISTQIEKLANIQYKATDKGAKKFAALIGFILSDIIFLTNIFQLPTVSLTAAAIIGLFSFLEAAFGFCAGCYVYTFLTKIPVLKLNESLDK